MKPSLEVADVFRDGEPGFLARYGPTLSREQRRAFRAVTQCRTAALGGHVQRCSDCGHEKIQYNSCRNRHCPKCQAMARAAWLEKRESELLPVPYFHVVFTLPHELAPLALQNKRVAYGLLFRAASRTLLEVAADPKHLGAQIGCLMVLHTWGQNLTHHPHIHAVVTGGGLSPDGSRWVHGKTSVRRQPFFAPVKILSRVFRGKFIALLKQACASGELGFHGQLQPLSDAAAFEGLLNKAVRHDWVVYAKRPFASPNCVLKYLARYTHRVAISNQRLVKLGEGQVSFRYKDYPDDQQAKIMCLSTPEFIRRFLMHTLPSRFVRIRYYGLSANRNRDTRLDKCRCLLGVAPKAESPDQDAETLADRPDESLNAEICPVCRRGTLVRIDLARAGDRSPPPRPHLLTSAPVKTAYVDTS